MKVVKYGTYHDVIKEITYSMENECLFQKTLTIIQNVRPDILIRYSHKIETLMKEDPQLFINNIQSGNYPTREGTWK